MTTTTAMPPATTAELGRPPRGDRGYDTFGNATEDGALKVIVTS